jgi:hypothetical protein|nr:MAG TPA: hypothetical protein [Bacteriophage sp.]DAJ19968.1 MAG TPA: hypothetical protein [Myoviridae sp. ctiIS8]DAP87737.1 MAG TPA: hypothetical protein [Caudoviricetes sp.]DAI63824.1 MAG TPA: hypothetical protein [Bacteriophage sp.]DAU39090.1 MAG TPA: hypothetical protein [Bacteriophage sp.]
MFTQKFLRYREHLLSHISAKVLRLFPVWVDAERP